MPEDRRAPDKPPDRRQAAEHEVREAILTDVIVPIVATGVGGVAAGAAQAVVSHHANQRPSTPMPPSIELPPDVDVDK